MTQTITDRWAEFLTGFGFEGIPPEVLRQTKLHIIDDIGCTLGAYSLEWGKKITAVGRDMGGRPEATAMGSGTRLHCANAAYVNGKLSNVLDMDETIYHTRHIGGVPFYSALAVAERMGAAGKDVLLATLLGYDFGARAAMCGSIWKKDPDKGVVSGVYGSSAFNTFAATIAAGLIFGFDKGEMANALGVAGFMTPGPIESKFSFTPPASINKSADMGWFCLGGIMAAICAQNGYVGDASVLDGPRGLAALLGALEFDYDTFVADLGERWYIMDAGYKPYPTCRWFHNAAGLFEGLVRENGIKPEEITGIHVNTHPLGITLPTYAQADKWYEVKDHSLWFSQFSLSYALACIAHGITPGPAWAKEENLNSPRLADFTRKVSRGAHPAAIQMAQDWQGHIGRIFSQPPSSVAVQTARGTFFAEGTDIPGDSWNPEARLSEAQIIAKFRNNAAYAVDAARVDGIVEKVLRLDEITDLAELTRLLA